MTGQQLQEARLSSKATQVEAARSLGVSQTYLSLLEKGRRPMTLELCSRAVTAFGLPATAVPLPVRLAGLPPMSDDQLAFDLATLGYPGFAYMKSGKAKNPVEVLLLALKANDRDARLVEALPWIVLTFPDMDWPTLAAAAKQNDLQNRLGYVTEIARLVATHAKNKRKIDLISVLAKGLESSRLVRVDTLCRNHMTEAEKRWLKTHRPKAAKHWNMLTDLSPESVNYYE
jgi:transcriptional regulator with XRE-family HTH domain